MFCFPSSIGKFNDNYLCFSLLNIAVVCDNVYAAIQLTKYSVNPLQLDLRGRTSLHLANSLAMLEILLSTKSSQEFSPKMTFKESVLFCQCFKFIPALLTGLTCSCADLNINVTDNNWNTPLHAMMSRISEMNRCLGSVETLVNKGAATDIRNKHGHLPIDLFRTIF